MYNRTQELILFLLVALLVVFSYITPSGKMQTPRFFKLPSEHFRININTAEWRELDLLPGVGESRAKEIVNCRREIGGFKEFSELSQIKGISKNLINKIQKMATVD